MYDLWKNHEKCHIPVSVETTLFFNSTAAFGTQLSATRGKGPAAAPENLQLRFQLNFSHANYVNLHKSSPICPLSMIFV